MSSGAPYAGVIVTDVARSAPWYEAHLGCRRTEEGEGWACLTFPDGSRIELFAGDPADPGSAYPSYGCDPGPRVLPALGVPQPLEAVRDHRVVRQLPDWVVVVGPGGVRVVLTVPEGTAASGLLGFRWRTPEPEALGRFLRAASCGDPVETAEAPELVLRVAGTSATTLDDPDGQRIERVPVR